MRQLLVESLLLASMAPHWVLRRATGACRLCSGSCPPIQFRSGTSWQCRQCTGLALQCGPCDGVGPDLWTVTGLVVFAPTPDGDCPDDRRRKPASASPPARGSNCADGAVARGHRRDRPGLIGLYRTSLGYDPHNVIIASNQPSREQLHGMGRPRHVLCAPTESNGRRAPSRIDRACHLQRDTTRSGARSVVDVPGRDMTGDRHRFSNGSAPTTLRR